MDADNKHREFIPLEKLYEAVEYLASREIYFIQWTGGEPLLYPDLIKALTFAKEKGISSSLFTNGLLINENNIKQLKELVSNFAISLDGGEANNNLDRGGFNKVMDTLKIFKNNDIHYSISSTLSKRNLNSMEEIACIARDYGAHIVRFNAVSFFGRASLYADEMLSDSDMEYIKNEAKELTIKNNYEIVIETNLLNSREIKAYGRGLSNTLTKAVWINKKLEISFFPFAATLKDKNYSNLYSLDSLHIEEIEEKINHILEYMMKENRTIYNIYEEIQLRYYSDEQRRVYFEEISGKK